MPLIMHILSYLILSYLILSYLILSYLILSYLYLYFISFHFIILFYFILFYFILFHFILLFYFILFYFILFHFISFFAMPVIVMHTVTDFGPWNYARAISETVRQFIFILHGSLKVGLLLGLIILGRVCRILIYHKFMTVRPSTSSTLLSENKVLNVY